MSAVRNPDGSLPANLVRLPVVVRRETDAAYGINYPLVWLPKSQCEMSDWKQPDRKAELTIPSWLALKKGLI